MAEARTTHCKRCGAIGLFWTKSARTGRWYLCNAMTVGTYMGKSVPCPQSPHKCDGWKALTTDTPDVKAAVAAERAAPPDHQFEARGMLLSALRAANPGANRNDVETAARNLIQPATSVSDGRDL